MSTAQAQNEVNAEQRLNGGSNGTNGSNEKEYENLTRNMTHEEHQAAATAARFGYGPLAHVRSEGGRLPAFGGEFQPGTYKAVKDRNIANPAPLGLCAFALTTFVLSLVNMGTDGITEPNIAVALAFGYGGLVQLLAGMWEMAVGNTFGATALSSYGGFWLAFGIVLTPGGFDIQGSIETADGAAGFYNSFGLFLMAWFIFTFLMMMCTLRSTLAFFSLFFFLMLTFLLLGIGYLVRTDGAPTTSIIKAGGFFGIWTAFIAWYNAMAGILDDSNSFFIVPVAHFPWSEKGMALRGKKSAEHIV